MRHPVREFLEGIRKCRSNLPRNSKKPTFSFQNFYRAFGSSNSSLLLSKLLSTFGCHRAFDSQNLPLKFGFLIGTFDGQYNFWDPKSTRSEQNRNLGVQSFDSYSGPKQLQSKLPNESPATKSGLRNPPIRDACIGPSCGADQCGVNIVLIGSIIY